MIARYKRIIWLKTKDKVYLVEFNYHMQMDLNINSLSFQVSTSTTPTTDKRLWKLILCLDCNLKQNHHLWRLCTNSLATNDFFT